MNLQTKVTLGICAGIYAWLLYVSRFWEEGPWLKAQCKRTLRLSKIASKMLLRYSKRAQIEVRAQVIQIERWKAEHGHDVHHG